MSSLGGDGVVMLVLFAFTLVVVSLLLLLQIYIACFLNWAAPRGRLPAATEGPLQASGAAADVTTTASRPTPAAAEDDFGANAAAAASCLPRWVGGYGGCGEEPADCVVCLSELEGDGDGNCGGASVRVLPRCRHAFHAGCIGRWLVSHSMYCPICRTPVRPEKSDTAGEDAAVVTSPGLPAEAARTDEEAGVGAVWEAHGAVLLDDHLGRHDELHLSLLQFY